MYYQDQSGLTVLSGGKRKKELAMIGPDGPPPQKNTNYDR